MNWITEALEVFFGFLDRITQAFERIATALEEKNDDGKS